MLFNNKAILNLPLGSIRSSGRIGTVTDVLINPNNLHVDALKCRVLGGKEQLLSPTDIRDFTAKGVIINDHDNLLDKEDAVRMKPILEIDYKLVGKQAFIGKRKVGVVDGYALESESFFIKKIYVTPGLLARLKSDTLTFDRTSVKEVTDTKVVFESNNKVKAKVEKSVNNIQSLAIPQPSTNASFASENE